MAIEMRPRVLRRWSTLRTPLVDALAFRAMVGCEGQQLPPRSSACWARTTNTMASADVSGAGESRTAFITRIDTQQLEEGSPVARGRAGLRRPCPGPGT